jgi:hypothetical protein
MFRTSYLHCHCSAHEFFSPCQPSFYRLVNRLSTSPAQTQEPDRDPCRGFCLFKCCGSAYRFAARMARPSSCLLVTSPRFGGARGWLATPPLHNKSQCARVLSPRNPLLCNRYLFRVLKYFVESEHELFWSSPEISSLSRESTI